jgi:uncharacterized membrane protein (UPF0127 family)
MIVYDKKRKIEIIGKELGFWGRFSGLMFKTSKTSNLIFTFSKNVNYNFHSFFVFFPFLILWIDEKDKIIDKRIIKPFNYKISTVKKYRKVVEIPLNNQNKRIVKLLVGEAKI